MRVIAGEFRSRRLQSLKGLEVRPTPDRLRETLFDIIGPQLAGVIFVDAFAGTGAVGIEALSRGAARAIFIEKSRTAAEVITSNLTSLNLLGRARVIRGSVRTYLDGGESDVVFLDPPYDLPAEYSVSLDLLGRTHVKLAIAQHDRRTELKANYGNIERFRELRQGDNVLSFFRPKPE